MRPPFVFADMSPIAGILLVLATVLLSGLMWVVMFAATGILDRRERRRAEELAPVGKEGRVIIVADTSFGIVRLEPEGDRVTEIKCKTAQGVVEKGARVRVTGYDRKARLYVVAPRGG
jgi:hypothetical protein